MAKKSMNEKLKNLKAEKEGDALPDIQKIIITDGDERGGTWAGIAEEIEIDPKDQPKPTPKQSYSG